MMRYSLFGVFILGCYHKLAIGDTIDYKLLLTIVGRIG